MRFRSGFAWRSFTGRVAQALFVAAVVCISLGATDPTARFNDLGHKMMCTCGCAEILLECNHVGCPVSGGMRDELSHGIADGLADSAILRDFAQRYGEVVLAAPTTEGFNLLAWIMPFAVSAIALIGTILLVRNWAKHAEQHPVTAGETIAANSAVGNVGAHQYVGAGGAAAMRERIRRETGTDGEV